MAVHDKQNVQEIILSILNCCQLIFSFSEEGVKKKVILTSQIKDHGVWQDTSKWTQWIMKVIENKRSVFTEKEEEKASRSGWSFRKLVGSFVGTVDETKVDRINGNILFNTLTLFI